MAGGRVDCAAAQGYNTIALERNAGDTGDVLIDALIVHDSTALAYRGADLPYITYEAEHMETNGERIGPSRVYLDAAAEASGRQAVKLTDSGHYVEFTTAADANAIVVRYSIPDSPGGGGQQSTLEMYVNGEFRTNLTLTSEYAWVYGNYPWSNDPKQGSGHRHYDDVHALAGDIPAGSTIRLQQAADNAADYVVIDLVDLEQAPEQAYEMPEGFLSIADYGAAAGDEADDAQALRDAIDAAKARGLGVWIPAGVYNMHDGLIVLDDVTIRGAGMWHTKLRGAKFFGNGANIRVYDLMIDGELSVRDDEAQTNGFEGAFGPGSTVQHVWIEHTKTGMWLTRPINKNGYEFDLDAYTDGLYVGGGRIRNVMADGINFSVNTKNSMAEHMNIRYTGDDALAMWSFVEHVPTDYTENNTYRFNTVHLPWLANNIIIFGGKDHKVQDNIVMDNLTHGSGISVSTKFTPTAYEGSIIVERNTLIRTGARDPGLNMNVGAIWVYAFDRDIDTEVMIRDNVVLDSTYHGLSVQGGKTLGSYSADKAKVTVQNTVIDGAGLTGMEIAPTVNGAINLDNVIIRGAKLGDISNRSPNFTIHYLNSLGEGEKPTDPEPKPRPGGRTGGGDDRPPARTDGGGDAELNGRRLLEAVRDGQNRIVFESAGGSDGMEAAFPVEALQEAAAANGNAVIVVKHGEEITYELPVRVMDLIRGGMIHDLDPAGGYLIVSIRPAAATDSIVKRAEEIGVEISAEPIEFMLMLEKDEERYAIRHFGATHIIRTIMLDRHVDAARATVLSFDPDTGEFRFVPATFSTVEGKTVVTIKSAFHGIFFVADYKKTFADVSGHWAQSEIERLASKYVVFGKSGQRFAPDQQITRAEFAAMLVRMLGIGNSNEEVGLTGGNDNGAESARGTRMSGIFRDVPEDAWFADTAATAAGFGIVTGYGDGKFRPDVEITREQLAAMAARAYVLVRGETSAAPGTPERLTDATDIGAWAQAPVAQAVSLGLMSGLPDGRFAPQETATRAEAAVVIARLAMVLEFIHE